MRKTKNLLAENRQARHQYFIEDEIEAGIVLEGWEVKAILAGQANFSGGTAFVRIENNEAFVEALAITALNYSQQGLLQETPPMRAKKLLLHKEEIVKLKKKVSEKGYTVVPLALTKERKIKVLIGLAKGKKLVDKRDTLKERDQKRELNRALKSFAD